MTTDEIKNLVISKAGQWGINPSIALAQIQRESGFDPRARGASGERGLAQFMPATWARFGSGGFDNAFDPVYALDAWGSYMTYLLGLFGGDYSRALTGYNGGEGHLTDPGRYGPPSAAALGYASSILAQAGASGPSSGAPASTGILPGVSNTVLLLALLGLGLVFFTRD